MTQVLKPDTSGELERAGERSGPITDLVLTLPIFVGYHLGVIFLPVRNAADIVTRELVALADNNLLAYAGLTLAIGALFVVAVLFSRRRSVLRWQRFALVAGEGVLYAVAMYLLARTAVGALPLAGGTSGSFTGLIMSLGAGFYEEIAFRVLLYGMGLRLLLSFFVGERTAFKRLLVTVGWALATAVIFSGWHYVGSLGDAFDLRGFTFRMVCGLVFVLIFQFRGFAPAVWTHTLYDIWVLVL